jgi:type III secretion protein U
VSGDQTGANRTEQPTPRRLREARRRGDVARSRELAGVAALAGGLVAVAAMGPSIATRLAAHLRWSLVTALSADLPPLTAVRGSLRVLALSTLPICGTALFAGGLVAAIQVGGLRFSFPAIAFRLERLNPAKGLLRICSPAQIVTAVMGLAKVLAAGVLAFCLWSRQAETVFRLPRLEPRSAAAAVVELLAPLTCGLCAALAAFGLADLLRAHRRHRRALRMTRDEVRRDLKEQEGDPLHKAERRQRHRALALADPISRATCVVVNPTELAVALQHHRGSDEAPVVLAKGSGKEAACIRSQARRAGVPLVREIALARALFQLAEVGEEIPEELYEAAAEVLVHVYGAAAREERN